MLNGIIYIYIYILLMNIFHTDNRNYWIITIWTIHKLSMFSPLWFPCDISLLLVIRCVISLAVDVWLLLSKLTSVIMLMRKIRRAGGKRQIALIMLQQTNKSSFLYFKLFAHNMEFMWNVLIFPCYNNLIFLPCMLNLINVSMINAAMMHNFFIEISRRLPIYFWGRCN